MFYIEWIIELLPYKFSFKMNSATALVNPGLAFSIHLYLSLTSTTLIIVLYPAIDISVYPIFFPIILLIFVLS